MFSRLDLLSCPDLFPAPRARARAGLGAPVWSRLSRRPGAVARIIPGESGSGGSGREPGAPEGGCGGRK